MGDKLKIPTDQFILNYKLSKKRRLPSSISANIKGKGNFKASFLLEEEIYYLSGSVANKYVQLFREVVEANEKKVILKRLKEALDYSRLQKNHHLEEAFLSLLTSTIDSSEKSNYLNQIRSFFKSWKSIRGQRKLNGARQ